MLVAVTLWSVLLSSFKGPAIGAELRNFRGPTNVSLRCAGPNAVRLTWDSDSDFSDSLRVIFRLQAPPFVPGGPGTVQEGPPPVFFVPTHQREQLLEHSVWDDDNVFKFTHPSLVIDNDTVLHLEAVLEHGEDARVPDSDGGSVWSNCVRLADMDCEELDCPPRLPSPRDLSLECNGSDAFRLAWRTDVPAERLDGFLIHLAVSMEAFPLLGQDNPPIALRVPANATDITFQRPKSAFEMADGDNPYLLIRMFSLPEGADARSSIPVTYSGYHISNLFDCIPELPPPTNFTVECHGTAELIASWEKPDVDESLLRPYYLWTDLWTDPPPERFDSYPEVEFWPSDLHRPFDIVRRLDPWEDSAKLRKDRESYKSGTTLAIAAVPKKGVRYRPSKLAVLHLHPWALCPPPIPEVSVDCCDSEHLIVSWLPVLSATRTVKEYRVLVSSLPANETEGEAAGEPWDLGLYVKAKQRVLRLRREGLGAGRRFSVRVAPLWAWDSRRLWARDFPGESNEAVGVIDLTQCKANSSFHHETYLTKLADSC